MNLKRIENVLERAFEGVFDRALPGRLHPVELFEALWQALEEKREEAQVPNRLLALLSPADLEAFAAVPLTGEDSVESGLGQRAAEQGWSPGVALMVALRADPEARPGTVSVRVRLDREPIPAHLLVESGPVAGDDFALHPGARVLVDPGRVPPEAVAGSPRSRAPTRWPGPVHDCGPARRPHSEPP